MSYLKAFNKFYAFVNLKMFFNNGKKSLWTLR